MATSRLIVDHDLLKRAETDAWALQFARIEVWVFAVDLQLPIFFCMQECH